MTTPNGIRIIYNGGRDGEEKPGHPKGYYGVEKPASLPLALNCGIASSAFNALVNALLRLHIVRALKSGCSGREVVLVDFPVEMPGRVLPVRLDERSLPAIVSHSPADCYRRELRNQYTRMAGQITRHA